MGEEPSVPLEGLGGPEFSPNGDPDERPVRSVSLSEFFLSESEVTVEQYREFRPGYQDAGKYSPYLSGISWEDAQAFCEWLSEKEDKTYRLPTEAEWEFACRAGTDTPFSSGNQPPDPETANPLGIRNMQTGVAEWCLDWYGPYPSSDEKDPTGPETGVARVVRGGTVQDDSAYSEAGGVQPYFRRSANRAGAPADFRGQHTIGFRVVQAAYPETPQRPQEIPFVQQCVKEGGLPIEAGPDLGKPFFRVRKALPIPPENVEEEAIQACGLPQGILGHNHCPGLTVCSNGDLLAMFFSSSRSHKAEYWPNVGLIATRLRFGAEEWDPPSPFFDIPDINDQSVLLWNDNGKIWMFWGGIGLSDVPFKWCVSSDHGSTWSPMRLPFQIGRIGGYTPQPISSAFRDEEGAIYSAMDGLGAHSFLWKSEDEGMTWSDTGGRTGGRHTVFVPLQDGSVVGMGGKSSDIDGFMPKSITKDWGKSYEIEKTDFPALASNQRPSFIRLASGRLLFAGDYQNFNGKKPTGVTENGSYVALSDDEGETWTIKKIDAAQPHESKAIPLSEEWAHNGHPYATLGYSVARQAPNGMIHLLTTMNHPCLHFEFNEAWVLGKGEASTSEGSADRTIERIEQHANGTTRAKWSGEIGNDGIFRLNGAEKWSYPDGTLQYEVHWTRGRKTGVEAYWDREGKKSWEWEHAADGKSIWRQWWPNGKMKSESTWIDGACEGVATLWDADGVEQSRVTFHHGFLSED
ncbi:MAG: SUMF1/EgtB/PvdO family nonheme iron enzyme [Candidatus Omnitrophica bacterium]|nr:SUMF1/EgtB/PvdO family nonheme iron enzyme [Candidatus Omnitrophota bacterium]